MRRYLLDTNICILLMKSRTPVLHHLARVGPSNCFVSEITIAELLFGVKNGVEKSANPEAERSKLEVF